MHLAMAHNFILPIHDPDEAYEPIPAKPSKKKAQPSSAGSGQADDEKHRTVGISMSPQLRERAAARARAVGLSFSRYVQWCLEAELAGRRPEELFAEGRDKTG
jgi:hypothetical protein